MTILQVYKNLQNTQIHLSDANSTFLSDLQNDSEEDCYTERDLNAELPLQDDSHFKKFERDSKTKNQRVMLKAYCQTLKKTLFFWI